MVEEEERAAANGSSWKGRLVGWGLWSHTLINICTIWCNHNNISLSAQKTLEEGEEGVTTKSPKKERHSARIIWCSIL
jgi:hypothetical protein